METLLIRVTWQRSCDKGHVKTFKVSPGSSFERGDSKIGKGDPDAVISPLLNSCLLDSSKSVSSRICVIVEWGTPYSVTFMHWQWTFWFWYFQWFLNIDIHFCWVWWSHGWNITHQISLDIHFSDSLNIWWRFGAFRNLWHLKWFKFWFTVIENGRFFLVKILKIIRDKTNSFWAFNICCNRTCQINRRAFCWKIILSRNIT